MESSDEATPFVDPNEEEADFGPALMKGTVKRSSIKLCPIVGLIAGAVVVLVLTFMAGFLVGYFSQAEESHSEQVQGSPSCMQSSSVSISPSPSPQPTSRSQIALSSSMSSARPTPSCSPGPTPSMENWGSHVMNGSDDVSVLEWMDDNLSNDRIQENLRWGM